MLQKSKKNGAWRPAATSCVWPDTALANCRQLAALVPEVGLYLLELVSCQAYGPEDLPRERHGLSYHLHLPLDLPWERGGGAVFSAVADLIDKTAHLAPWGFVLHPPRQVADLVSFVDAFALAGHDPAAVLLENTEEVSPAAVVVLASASGCSVCLDLGHMLAMAHALPEAAVGSGLVRMLHVYAPWGERGLPPGKRHVHASLAALDAPGWGALGWMLDRLDPEVVVAEVFSPADLTASLAVLEAARANPFSFVPGGRG